MSNVRKFQLDEITLRPGTYFNPQTEVMIVVDDSPEFDHELFEAIEVEAEEWIQISEEIALDEHRRDELVERFQHRHQQGSELGDGDDEPDEEDDLDEDEDEDDELDGVEELRFDAE